MPNSRNIIRAIALGVVIFLAGLLITPMLASAQGAGIALSGTFCWQRYEMVPGMSISTPAAYVNVQNTGELPLQVTMLSNTPAGVNIIFSEEEFTLPAGGGKRVGITVEVLPDAVPGEYTISVTAEGRVTVEGGGEVKIAGAAGQEAPLIITGESAKVIAQTLNPKGDPIPTKVFLAKVTDDGESQVGYSETGLLEITVTPGQYHTWAYLAEREVAGERFTIAANEEKTISLTVSTAYFSGFTITPSYYTKTGRLASVKIFYHINNVYELMTDVELILKVSLDGEPLEEVPLLSLSQLSLGGTSGNWEYTPPQGWEGSGTYSFNLELLVGGELYTTSLEEELEVVAPTAGTAPFSLPLMVVLGGITGAVLIIFAVMLVRKRRASGD